MRPDRPHGWRCDEVSSSSINLPLPPPTYNILNLTQPDSSCQPQLRIPFVFPISSPSLSASLYFTITEDNDPTSSPSRSLTSSIMKQIFLLLTSLSLVSVQQILSESDSGKFFLISLFIIPVILQCLESCDKLENKEVISCHSSDIHYDSQLYKDCWIRGEIVQAAPGT